MDAFPALLGQQFWAVEAFGGEKNESDTFEYIGGASNPPPRPSCVVAVFAEENSWSRSLKKAQKKNECVVVSSFVYNQRESGTRIPQSALRFVLRII